MNKDKINICPKQLCTGCGCCKSKCPKNAINIITDSEGFQYPIIDKDKCIDCKICEKVCPILCESYRKIKAENQKAYTCEIKDKDILLASSSGGAFSAIVEAFCDSNYIIFGVEFDKENVARHTYIDDKKLIGKYRKSKYVQSDIGNSYIDAEKFLKQGKKVLFTGTPCQIAGLKNYLKVNYDNLLTIDLVCHGVPSPKVLKKYIEFIQNKYNSKIEKIQFREKVKQKKKYNSKNLMIITANKTIIENFEENHYLRGFHWKLFYRPSCLNCKYANLNRVGDITIGDMWGIEKIYPNIDVHKGQSLLILNSSKGQAIFDKLQYYMNYKEIDINFAASQNAQLREPTKFNKNRQYFFDNIDTMPFDKLIDKCVPKNVIKIILKKILPNKILVFIKDRRLKK